MSVAVLVVDDHPLVRSGFRFLAEARSEIEVVGEASSEAEAVASAARLQPDVVVMDIELRDGNGIDAAIRIRRETPSIRVLFVTMHNDESSLLAALRAGGSGFIVKGAHQDELVRAILAAAAGELILGAHAAHIFSERIQNLDPARSAFPQLTEREREVLTLMAAGQPNTVIAQRLGLSRKTIANHVSNITLKLPAQDRGHAIIMARDAGLGH